MDLSYVKNLSYDQIRKDYKIYLQEQELGRNTINTVLGDSLYLWNNAGKETFWEVVFSQNFEVDAKEALNKALLINSSGNVSKLLNGYVSNLRRFRNYILNLSSKECEKDDATVLKEFLLDIECLDPLAEWTSKFNLFDILKISRVEIRHSNMLSWLINPNENHGLGDLVIRGFIQYVVSNFSGDVDVFDTLLMSFHDFVVLREWHHIDLLAVSEDEKFVLCVENKIDTGEHDNQLKRYKNIVMDTYADYKKMFIYLSPEGTESSDPDVWCSMGYADVLEIIEKSRKKVKLLPDAELLIDNYIETIRRDIVGDERLAKVCAEIYAKHKKALDLIFENKPDKASDLAAVLRAWALEKTEQGEMEVVLEKCVKSYTRFKTKRMSEIMPDAENSTSGWGTKNYYFYEIRNNEGNEFFIQLSLSSKDIPEHLREMCDRINVHFPSRQQKANWQWRIPFVTKHSKVGEEISEDKVFEQLNKRFEEIKAFEDKLIAFLDGSMIQE